VHEPAQALAEAGAAWQRGDWETVVTLLADVQPARREQRVAVALLRAGAALRAGAPAVALEQLDALAGVTALPDELTTAQVLRGRALLALGRVPDGLTTLREAVRAASAARCPEVLLALAEGCLGAGHLDQAEPVLDSIPTPDAGGPDATITRARLLAAHGWLELLRWRRPIAARHFADALDVIARASDSDPNLHASLLELLLTIAIDTLDLRLLQRVRRDVEDFDWEPAPLQAHARAVRALLVRADLLLGDSDAAWDTSLDLRLEAAPGLERLRADLLAAQVARAAGETWTPAQIIEQAAVWAGQIAWTRAGERTLLELVCEMAARDPDTARNLLASYDWLPAADPAQGLRDDSDIAPLELLARAGLDDAARDRTRQLKNLRRSIARWRDVGHAYGELRAVLTLARVKGDADLLQRADELSRLAPRSWLRRDYEAVRTLVNGVQKLSPTEYKVMLALAQGMTTGQIAHVFERSRNTIRNQTRRVFVVMGVHSRSALVVRCAALGLLGAQLPASTNALPERNAIARGAAAQGSFRSASTPQSPA
jgi:DNA-binding CsgD family transcriptional regulator